MYLMPLSISEISGSKALLIRLCENQSYCTHLPLSDNPLTFKVQLKFNFDEIAFLFINFVVKS